ncbi:MAG: LamG domain-containing protein, partial [Planctomycetes bacterium]|nr:LamG domain-containing protein [Planctomycetota bacterium]
MGRFTNAWASVALVASIVLLLGVGTGSAAIVDNLVAHWTFDDNTAGNEYLDSAGSNHGTAQGTVPALATGLIGAHTLELAGAGTINVGSSTDFDTTTYTISAWLNADTTSGWRTAVGSWFGGATWMHMGNDAGTTFGDHGGGQTSGGAVVLGQWNHVVSVRNPGVENQLWVNGVKMAQTSVGTPQIPGANNVYIGSKDGVPGNPWDGKIDDVGIWSRAITSDEVREIY